MFFIHLLSHQPLLTINFPDAVVHFSTLGGKIDGGCFVVGLGFAESFEHFSLLTCIVSEYSILADVLSGELVQTAATFLVVVYCIIFNRRSITLIIMIFDFTTSFFLIMIIS